MFLFLNLNPKETLDMFHIVIVHITVKIRHFYLLLLISFLNVTVL
jgi:hypothetical protein